MADKKGDPVRPIRATSILDKRFRRVGSVKQRITRPPAHPVFVLMDLKRGSLRSLDLYLQQYTEPFDREVARAISRLISGTVNETRLRLEVVDHPDAPRAKGSRPKAPDKKRQQRDRQIAEQYAEMLSQSDKPYIAVEKLAARFCVSQRTVNRAISEAELQLAHQTNARRQSWSGSGK
jgi:predicted DNA-binding protein (UPF0251 family)